MAKPDSLIPRSECVGCKHDADNHAGRSATGRCWFAPSATIVTRYQIGWWTRPEDAGAFAEVRVPSCYRQEGSAFYAELPHFVRLKDVVRRKGGRRVA